MKTGKRAMARIVMKDGSGIAALKYLIEDVDRHGNVRVYVRRKGQPKVRLRERPGTSEFLEEYRQAICDRAEAPEESTPSFQRAAKGSLRWLCEQYYGSAEYKQLEPRTRHVRRLILDPLCQRDGDKPYALLEPRHIRKRRDEKAAYPEAANGLIKALRQVFNFAVENDIADRNPARDVPYLRSASEGFHSWTPEEIEQFEAHHDPGTKARLALALLLYTGQRRSDVVALGRQHLKDGWLTFTQVKNRKRNPVTLSIPVHPDLDAVIDATPSGHMNFLVTEFGKPFTANGFGNWFRKQCDAAGLSHCSAHGLRKAAAARLAELGAGESEIMAITGHRTSKEVTRYTRGARQKVLAAKAMARLSEDRKANKSVPLSAQTKSGGTFKVKK
jgi:integrase